MQSLNFQIARSSLLSELTGNEAMVKVETPRLQLDFIDGLRALAALYVMLDHAALQVWPVYTTTIKPQGYERILFALFSQAHFAVSIFIVISGFCLMLPVVRSNGVLKGGAFHFFYKRARRILPPYYCAMALSLLLIALLIGHKTGTHWDSSIPVTWQGFVAHLLLLQDFYGAPQINHVFWSIAVECQIYFLFPVLVLLWNRIGVAKTFTAALMLSLLGVAISRHAHFSKFTPQYLELFVTGMLASTIAYGTEPRWKSIRERYPWLQMIIVSIFAATAMQHLGRVWIADYFVGSAAMSLLILLSRTQANRSFQSPPGSALASIGIFAYSIYLIHAPLLQVIWQYMLQPLHISRVLTFSLLAAIGSPLIVGCAYLFYLVCERPFVTKTPH